MRSITLNRLFALALVTSLAACQSTPQQEDTAETEQQQPQQTEQQDTAQTQPAKPAKPQKPMQEQEKEQKQKTTKPVTADNFHNHPSNYDGTTDTRKVYFAFDKSNVPSAAFETLRAHARHLKSNENATLRLAGHADKRGTREYNVALGERRAKAVAKFLRLQGVSSDQLETVSYGEEKPARKGSTEMAYAHNRRVVLEYQSGRP